MDNNVIREIKFEDFEKEILWENFSQFVNEI